MQQSELGPRTQTPPAAWQRSESGPTAVPPPQFSAGEPDPASPHGAQVTFEHTR